MRRFLSPLGLSVSLLLVCNRSMAENQTVSITVSDHGGGDDLAPLFLGLSYEVSTLRSQGGRYYFDPHDQALINTFKTLGIKSLRVGANAVDDPKISPPKEKDIDEFFDFARAAGVKVIYSFRLKNGDPAESARLAAYIQARYADVLSCFSIGNEPNFYLKTFDDYFAQWKRQYDAILKAVPTARFDGPSVANAPPAAQNFYPLELAKIMFPGGHLVMASDHYYFLGRRNDVEKDPPASRARFLSNDVHATYQSAYAKIGAALAAAGVPYRIDELNSCARGGAKDSSDTYASTLWALDCTHWWAAHHILGLNYHTGEWVGQDGGFNGANYAVFVHQTNGAGFDMRPQAYALLAFTQGAHGRPIEIKTQMAADFNFNAYAYRDRDGSIYVTLINKSYGDQAQPATVSLQLPGDINVGTWQRMDLTQAGQDVSAKTGVVLGGAGINTEGIWSGQWEPVKNDKGGIPLIQMAPASATVLHFSGETKIGKQ